ncbi:MAG: 30S ribosomal protein S2 [Candidatus Melainabacteria bacterium]
MSIASLQDLLEAGVHFGHQVHRWNPKMKPYIWGERNGIYIIDLTKTSQLLDKAYEFMKQAASQGKKIVFVGTKKQASGIVEEEAKRCGAFFISRRWLGGTLTNFDTIRTRINRLRELEELRRNGHFERLGKKEAAVLTRQLNKLDRSLGGLKEMRGMPDIIFVVDQGRELIAIQEAKKSKLPVVCMVDTNCSPEDVDYVIPANDDAARSIRLIAGLMADAILAGKQMREGNRPGADVRGKGLPEVQLSEMAPDAEDAPAEERETVTVGAEKSTTEE